MCRDNVYFISTAIMQYLRHADEGSNVINHVILIQINCSSYYLQSTMMKHFVNYQRKMSINVKNKATTIV